MEKVVFSQALLFAMAVWSLFQEADGDSVVSPWFHSQMFQPTVL